MNEYKFELIEKTATRETVIGRYPTPERAEGERELRLQTYRRMKLSHGELIIRRIQPCKP